MSQRGRGERGGAQRGSGGRGSHHHNRNHRSSNNNNNNSNQHHGNISILTNNNNHGKHAANLQKANNQQQQHSSAFFLSNEDHLLNDDELLLNNNYQKKQRSNMNIDYDDDKNDETFGGSSNNDHWDQSDISTQSQLMFNTIRQQPSSSSSSFMKLGGHNSFLDDHVPSDDDIDVNNVGNDDIDDELDTQLSSVVQFAIGDDDLATPINARVQPQQIFTSLNNGTNSMLNIGDVEAQLKSNLHLGTSMGHHLHHMSPQQQLSGPFDILAHHHHMQQQQQQQHTQHQQHGAFSNYSSNAMFGMNMMNNSGSVGTLGNNMMGMHAFQPQPQQQQHILHAQQQPQQQQQQLLFNQSLNDMMLQTTPQKQQPSSTASTPTIGAEETGSTTPGDNNAASSASGSSGHRRTGSGYYLNVIYNTYNSKSPDATYNHIHRRLFPDTKLMSAEEIETIVRQQMQDLQIKNPFLDDFYYFSMTNKRGIEARKINATSAHHIQEALELYNPKTGKTEEELKREETLAHQPRVFGRIPSQNVRAPRAMFEIEEELKDLQNSPVSLATLRRDVVAQLNLLIENGLVFLIQIQESALCMRNIPNEMSPQAIHEYFGLCQIVARMLNVPTQQQPGFYSFYQILEKRKGIKFVSKALQHLPEPFIVHLLKSVLLYWNLIFSNFIARHEDADELRQRFIKDTITGVNSLSLVAICQILHDDPTRDDIIHINYADFFSNGGINVLTAMLKRAHEIIPSDPSTVNAWQSDFGQLFNHLRSFGFTRIATITNDDGWKLLENVLIHCNEHQTRAISEDLHSFLTQQPTPNMAGFLQRLMNRP